MKIKEVELKYFKFHQNLNINFDIENDCKNILIYGENGTGKSSIYEALYSNFYHQKRLDKVIDIEQAYKNRIFPIENLEVKIQFDNSQVLNRGGNIISSFDILKVGLFEPTIYFANERVLNRLTKENFYIALRDTLVEHFPNMKFLKDMFQDKFDEVRRWQNETKFKQKQTLKSNEKPISNEDIETQKNQFIVQINDLNEKFKEAFDQQIPLAEINKIIKENLDEDFTISFEDFQGAEIPITSGNIGLDFEISLPIIKIKIDDIECNGKLSQHFNEAKLKLVGVAIYFALAKKYEASGNGFKLLVLDDFLTSLDMANRKLIMKYILEEFKDYQKLILTHNLQFFNITKKLIKRHYNNNDWKKQFLFITQEEKGFIAYLKDKSNNYLFEAEKYLELGEYQISGNFLRKEFESLSEELRQILELGDVESLNQIIELIKKYESKKYYYFEPLTMMDFVVEKISYLKNKINGNSNETAQVNIYKGKIDEICTNFINNNKKDEIEALVSIIKNIEFYKDINFNRSSHQEKEEVYSTECRRGIHLLNELQKILVRIKSKKE